MSDKIPVSKLRGRNWTLQCTHNTDGTVTLTVDRIQVVFLAEILRELKLIRSDQKRELRRLTMAVEAVRAGIDRLPKGATP